MLFSTDSLNHHSSFFDMIEGVRVNIAGQAAEWCEFCCRDGSRFVLFDPRLSLLNLLIFLSTI